MSATHAKCRNRKFRAPSISKNAQRNARLNRGVTAAEIFYRLFGY